MKQGLLVLESGEVFPGLWQGGAENFGEVVFNTSHFGYEEMATDPSYFSQILVATTSHLGNYGVDSQWWESQNVWIKGFVCLEIQNSARDRKWLDLLVQREVPILSAVHTRELVLRLRSGGVCRGALLKKNEGEKLDHTLARAKELYAKMDQLSSDWTSEVSRKSSEVIEGLKSTGPRVAVLDFGCKRNILRELERRCSEIKVFPSRTDASEILKWDPDGILLSNGPGDPELVEGVIPTIQELIGNKFIFGICMGHQLLARAIGAKTFKLKFGHRGANHPIKDLITNQIYMTSQNHGYAVSRESLPAGVLVSHINLNDQTVSGIFDRERRFLGVQFHPENCPGPKEGEILFDYFVEQLKVGR